MIIYKNILTRLKMAGYTTTRLRKERKLSEATIQAIREGKPITTKAIDRICGMLQCQPGDILEYQLGDQDDNIKQERKEKD